MTKLARELLASCSTLRGVLQPRPGLRARLAGCLPTPLGVAPFLPHLLSSAMPWRSSSALVPAQACDPTCGPQLPHLSLAAGHCIACIVGGPGHSLHALVRVTACHPRHASAYPLCFVVASLQLRRTFPSSWSTSPPQLRGARPRTRVSARDSSWHVQGGFLRIGPASILPRSPALPLRAFLVVFCVDVLACSIPHHS